ncbi:Serine/threonine-protein kinase PrkC [Aquisphaera giovannonii]|uniref:Serine/threonine-protein kinase PrkC n=1 Tax=Aquisphaera giovannonii TaxID=406548 RepID=A0A5B9WAA3_9BACT|nr:FHA domain-containing serine/threonine-protein kinase [Aquisphaera giovannonii]QEH37011.1 Serine/threonine-protein kinase PrkC [Aquisphaera giovannonii]
MDVILRVIAGPHKGHDCRVEGGRFVVGRSSRASLPMTKDLALSREHFAIESVPPVCHIADLGSTNGTKVNGLRVERLLLRDGDTITAGDSHFRVQFQGSEAQAGDGYPLRCAGCDAPLRRTADPGGPVDDGPASPADSDDMPEGIMLSPGVWICERCELRRRSYPETSPDYLIEELIGEGGMGQVYRARQVSRNRRVAIKTMSAHAGGPGGEKAIEYFRREIQALHDMLTPGGSNHPCIVEFYELFQVEGQLQLVMEYVDGKNAAAWVRGLGEPLPIDSAVRIGELLLSALHYAHSRGYVHRDIKPSNLLVMGPARRPRLKLTDFGLAKSLIDSNVLVNLTRQGEIGGTVGFLSPEHIRQFGEVREPADIYGVGATLFYLLTQQYPYLGFRPERPDSYEMILEHPAVPLRAFRPDAPKWLEAVILKSLEKSPRDRWPSALEMWRALRPRTARGPRHRGHA